MKEYEVRWDEWRFPHDESFPDGIEQWPSWLVDAIHDFAEGRPLGQQDRVELDESGVAYLRLVAHEPNLKKARHSVLLMPAETDAGERALVVFDVD